MSITTEGLMDEIDRQARAIVDELDRLRAENSELRSEMVEVACGNCLHRETLNGFLNCSDTEKPAQQWCVVCQNLDARAHSVGSEQRRIALKLEAENADLRRHLEEAKSGWRVVSDGPPDTGEAQRTVYVAADDSYGAVKSAPWWPTVELATLVQGVVGTYIYAVTLTARKVTK